MSSQLSYMTGDDYKSTDSKIAPPKTASHGAYSGNSSRASSIGSGRQRPMSAGTTSGGSGELNRVKMNRPTNKTAHERPTSASTLGSREKKRETKPELRGFVRTTSANTYTRRTSAPAVSATSTAKIASTSRKPSFRF